MELKKIKITNKEISEKAELKIGDVTVKLNYSYTKDALPSEVSYEMFRKEGEFEQQFMGGALGDTNTFTSYNLLEHQPGDGALLDEVYLICKAIKNGEVEKE